MGKSNKTPPKNGKRFFWRYGDQTLKEDMSRHVTPRGSGRYGTGLYAYRTAHRMLGVTSDQKKDWEKTVEKEPYCQIDATGLKMFTPTYLSDVEKVSDGMLEITLELIDGKTTVDKAMERAGDIGAERFYVGRRGTARGQLTDDGLEITDEGIMSAILKTVECVKHNGYDKCSQPINHMLIGSGYDGVEPDPDEADDNHHGVVVFSESVEKLGVGCKKPKVKDIKAAVEREIADPYTSVEVEVPETLRKDYRKWLTYSLKSQNNAEKAAAEVNDEILQSCGFWEGGQTPTTNCKKLHAYWAKKIGEIKR